ncbi:hypothetical protein [Streptomyces sp. TLI_171]|uniref:hypothetical protein n=1 Tax=Streptomyces sp. TLI_171 TaxID=1938859 RepID=UPI000C18E784|nr:hypothetical protein [Streptomyces sp. TLI_171]RKE22448.1 hypothetical protein BX266_5892 [Streptomyces sp. TLI_171]
MDTSLPVRPVSPVLKALMLGPLAAAACWTFLTLWPAAGSTDDLFAWRMSPVTAALLGSAYGGAAVMLLLAVRARSWAEVRVVTAASALLMVLMAAATLAERPALHLSGGAVIGFLAAWGWLGVHLAALPIGLAALGAQLLTRGPAPARTPRLPWWVAAPMVSGGALLTLLGLALALRPGSLAAHWPWTARPLDVRALGAWALTFGAALLLASREAELRRVRSGMAAMVITGLLGLAGLIRYGGHVAWRLPTAWVVVLVLTALLGLGLCGYGVSAVLDPPRDPEPPREVEEVSLV